ncbi:NlpC/P60 family protein [Nonomuraea sp. M3C6]|uniref:NlpC/P60 family protein n=1 Tax=Nonomuraea marmarensis TaxID=3351344 RepID=A0ABW7AXQ4_9ACTN
MPTRLGRTTVAVALALVALASNPGAAVAEPSPAKARAKLVKLNEQADQVVEQYNQATETYKNAKKKYDALNTELQRKGAQADTLRKDIATVAVNDYQLGPSTGWSRFIGQGDPESMLAGIASLEQITQNRAAKIRAFEAATKDLRDRRNEAKTVLEEAETAREKVRDEKTKVDKLVDQQTKLLRRLGAFQTGDPNSPGIEYTGPASGNARQALQFAFAQVGKPYLYGGTGPGSYDCSGLTQAAWRTAGVELPRTTWTQWSWGASRRVPLDQLQPGDLLFSKGLGHMGMYAGNGKMVHAPQTGDVIKISVLDDYWRNRLLGAVRP